MKTLVSFYGINDYLEFLWQTQYPLHTVMQCCHCIGKYSNTFLEVAAFTPSTPYWTCYLCQNKGRVSFSSVSFLQNKCIFLSVSLSKLFMHCIRHISRIHRYCSRIHISVLKNFTCIHVKCLIHSWNLFSNYSQWLFTASLSTVG